MKLERGRVTLSATDLAKHLACRQLTTLDLRAARGEIERSYRHDTGLEALIERGYRHDLDHLAGTWSRKEAAAFESALREQRKIDPELWR